MQGAENVFLQIPFFFCPTLRQTITFRYSDINIVFSDIPHEIKRSLIGEESRSINPT